MSDREPDGSRGSAAALPTPPPTLSDYESVAWTLFESVRDAIRTAMEQESWGGELMWEDFERWILADRLDLRATIQTYKPHTLPMVEGVIAKLTSVEREILWLYLRLGGSFADLHRFDVAERLSDTLADDILEILWMEAESGSWR